MRSGSNTAARKLPALPLSLMLLRMPFCFFSGRTILTAALRTRARMRGAAKSARSLAAACEPAGKLSDKGERFCRTQLHQS